MSKRMKRLSKGENRSLNLMALARDERRMHREANATEYYFGQQLAERMMARENETYNPVVVSERVRDVIANVPESSDTLDLRSHIKELTNSELWDTVGRCSHVTKLILEGWKDITEKSLRSICISLGERLESIDLSNTPVTDDMMAVFVTRLFALKEAKLSSCMLLGSSGIRSLSNYTTSTLTSLDISHSIKMDSETIGWIAGTQGHHRKGCAKLVSLNASECIRIGDEGLIALSQGCKKLEFLNMSGCEEITDIGVCELAKGCTRLKVLSLPRLIHLTDKSLKSIGKSCHKLTSLNIARSGSFTDKGVKNLVNGCPLLTSLNIAGAVGVTEKGLGYLAEAAPHIGTLNVTGCQDISLNGLRAVIEGNSFVVEAKSYFGFYPKSDAVDGKLVAAQRAIENNATFLIHKTWNLYLLRKSAYTEAKLLRQHRAARVIQRARIHSIERAERRALRVAPMLEAAAEEVQRIFRGSKGRAAMHRKVKKSRWLRAQTSSIILIQTAWRGFATRIHDNMVCIALVDIYSRRQKECLSAAATFIQRTARKFLGRLRNSAWKELRGQRIRDEQLSAWRVQQCARMYIAYRKRLLLQAERERIAALQNLAACKIQSMFRGMQGQYNAMMTKAELERLSRLRNRKAVDCQRAIRGFLAREIFQKKKLLLERDHRLATKIQAVWRASRVLTWQALRMNKIAAFVFRREELALDEAAKGADEKNTKRIIYANRDSASDTEDEEAFAEEWTSFWDDAMGCTAWYSSKTNETVYEEPPKPLYGKYAFEEQLVGIKVRILWTLQNEWFRGEVVRFNRTKSKHRVDYPDGDHEWINFQQEKNRIQVETETDGVELILPLANYVPDTLEYRIKKANEVAAKKKAQTIREIENEYWICVGWDTDFKRFTWMNEQTGMIKMQVVDYEDWITDIDSDGFICYVNGRTNVTKSILDVDPRFEILPDSFEVEEIKIENAKDMSMGVYLCNSLMDGYNSKSEDDENGRRKAMNKILANVKKGFKTLQKSVTFAKDLYEPDEIMENENYLAAHECLKEYQVLVDIGEYQTNEIEIKRKALLKVVALFHTSTQHYPPPHIQLFLMSISFFLSYLFC